MKYSSVDIRKAIFPAGPSKRVSLEEIDKRIRERLRKTMRAAGANVLVRLVTGDGPMRNRGSIRRERARASILVLA